MSLLRCSALENNSVAIKIDKYIKIDFKYESWNPSMRRNPQCVDFEADH